MPISLYEMTKRIAVLLLSFPAILPTWCLMLQINTLGAQDIPRFDHDSSYFEFYPDKLVGRFYFSKKYTDLELESKSKQDDLFYKPNTTLNMGIGATYKIFTLNLAYGFGFLNPEKGKGETKYLDLQSHVYGTKWAIDLFGQFYKGYYLSPKGFPAPSDDSFYLRPDMRINMIGTAVCRILNNKKFSYRAAMMQSDWQKKSAGSVLLGGEMYYGVTRGDSAFVPNNVAGLYNQSGVSSLSFVELGPSAGYAYTLVVSEHFFITGSLSVNIDMSLSKETGPANSAVHFSIIPNYISRVVMGYNSRNWNINASFVGNRIGVRGASSADRYFIGVGNYRLTYAQRFTPGPKLRKRLLKWDRLLGGK